MIADKTPHDPLTPLEGRCLAMCPPKEAAERARTKELSKFETQSGTYADPPKRPLCLMLRLMDCSLSEDQMVSP